MVDFVLKIVTELRTLTTVSLTLCEPVSETLTRDTRYLIGYGDSIQKYPGTGGLRGAGPITFFFFGSILMTFFMHMFQMTISEKKIIDKFFFFGETFFHFLRIF